MTDYFALAKGLAEDTFQRAIAKQLTHWTRSDEFDRRHVRASCGKTVDWQQIPNHGEPPTCPRCRKDYDAYQQMEMA